MPGRWIYSIWRNQWLFALVGAAPDAMMGRYEYRYVSHRSAVPPFEADSSFEGDDHQRPLAERGRRFAGNPGDGQDRPPGAGFPGGGTDSQRNRRKNPRTCWTSDSGCSSAAKWPPCGSSSNQRRSVNRSSASRLDGRVMSRG